MELKEGRNDGYDLGPDCFYTTKPPKEFRLCTGAYLSQANAKADEYISLRLARFVCSTGLDGWIISSDEKRGSGALFHGEVMLCRPDAVSVLEGEPFQCSNFVGLQQSLESLGARSASVFPIPASGT